MAETVENHMQSISAQSDLNAEVPEPISGMIKDTSINS